MRDQSQRYKKQTHTHTHEWTYWHTNTCTRGYSIKCTLGKIFALLMIC